MTDPDPSTTDPAEDLAYLRALAEQGQRAVSLSGSYLLLWGVLIAGAYLNHYWATESQQIGLGYLAMALVGWAGSMLLGWREGRSKQVSGMAGRVYSYVFIGAGLILTIFAVGASLSPVIPGQAIMVVAALVIGSCFMVTGLIARLRPILVIGGLWFVAAIFLFTQLARLEILLYGAGLWLGLSAAPGAWLMWRNNRAQV